MCSSAAAACAWAGAGGGQTPVLTLGQRVRKCIIMHAFMGGGGACSSACVAAAGRYVQRADVHWRGERNHGQRGGGGHMRASEGKQEKPSSDVVIEALPWRCPMERLGARGQQAEHLHRRSTTWKVEGLAYVGGMEVTTGARGERAVSAGMQAGSQGCTAGRQKGMHPCMHACAAARSITR